MNCGSFALGNYDFIGTHLGTAVVYNLYDANSRVPGVIGYEPRLAGQPLITNQR